MALVYLIPILMLCLGVVQLTLTSNEVGVDMPKPRPGDRSSKLMKLLAAALIVVPILFLLSFLGGRPV